MLVHLEGWHGWLGGTIISVGLVGTLLVAFGAWSRVEYNGKVVVTYVGNGSNHAMTGYVGSIEALTQANSFFRHVLFTAKHSQLVVMCLQPGEEIGDEVHPNVDQFFRIEEGEAKFVFNETEHRVHGGDAVVIPAGTRHNVINASKTTSLRLYTVYSPPNHADGTVHKTKAEAEAAEAIEHQA